MKYATGMAGHAHSGTDFERWQRRGTQPRRLLPPGQRTLPPLPAHRLPPHRPGAGRPGAADAHQRPLRRQPPGQGPLRLLAGTGITFGLYVGTTPASGDVPGGYHRLPQGAGRADLEAAQRRLATGGVTVAPYEERLTEEAMAKEPPRLLFTNAKQLELLLTRSKDLGMFDGAPLRFIVCNEVHTCAGAEGASRALRQPLVSEPASGGRAKAGGRRRGGPRSVAGAAGGVYRAGRFSTGLTTYGKSLNRKSHMTAARPGAWPGSACSSWSVALRITPAAS